MDATLSKNVWNMDEVMIMIGQMCIAEMEHDLVTVDSMILAY